MAFGSRSSSSSPRPTASAPSSPRRGFLRKVAGGLVALGLGRKARAEQKPEIVWCLLAIDKDQPMSIDRLQNEYGESAMRSIWHGLQQTHGSLAGKYVSIEVQVKDTRFGWDAERHRMV